MYILNIRSDITLIGWQMLEAKQGQDRGAIKKSLCQAKKGYHH
jgi:hypothetical protein